MPTESKRGTGRGSARVGLLVLSALAVLLAGILIIGGQNQLFRAMNQYTVRFASVQGLQAGNPVQLAGVDVGRVKEIVLPADPQAEELVVHISVDQRYAKRIRRDSVARIQTLGLLGDKFVAITSGSHDAVMVEDGGEIEAAPPTDVDRILASGESAVENIVAISSDLAKILARVESGDSVLGKLLGPLPEEGRERTFFQTMDDFLDSIDRVSVALEKGESPVARLLLDDEMGARIDGSVTRLESSLGRLDAVLADLQEGDGLGPALLTDTEMKESFTATLASMQSASESLDAVIAEIETADGLVPKLLYDEGFAESTQERVNRILDRLDTLSLEVVEGDGTVPMLLRDPRVYEAINDVIVGVEESWLLRWLIRNRQRAGIEERYEDAREALGEEARDEEHREEEAHDAGNRSSPPHRP